jgi:hypothetical protein
VRLGKILEKMSKTRKEQQEREGEKEEENNDLHLRQIVSILLNLVHDSDSYVYLSATNALLSSVDVDVKTTMDVLLQAFVDIRRPLEQRTKLGEALALASQRCGAMLPHYAENLVESFLLCSASGSSRVLHRGGGGSSGSSVVAVGTEETTAVEQQQQKLAVEAFRASCLSNLADVCMTLGGNVKPYAHRICNVVRDLLQLEGGTFGKHVTVSSKVLVEIIDDEEMKDCAKNDVDQEAGRREGREEEEEEVKRRRKQVSSIHEKIGAGRSVRRSATFVLRAVIKASGSNVLHVLTSQLSPITNLLKFLIANDPDKVTRYHALEALSEFDDGVKSALKGKTGGKRNVLRVRV